MSFVPGSAHAAFFAQWAGGAGPPATTGAGSVRSAWFAPFVAAATGDWCISQARQIQLRSRPVASGAIPLIITPLVGRTPADIDAEMQAILPKRPDMLEWRIDFLPASATSSWWWTWRAASRKVAGTVPVLLTRRNFTEGGQALAIDEPAVLAMYTAAVEAGCVDLIDYELSNAPADLRRLREVSARHGVALIVSYHNLQCTPDPTTPWSTSSCRLKRRVPTSPRWR